MQFTLEATDLHSKARAGRLETDHGPILTPIFMPVGTQGSVKAIHQRELLADIEAQIILGNTYHLYLRPGMGVLEKAGGLHRFNGWHKPILTDSGGYQVYSLSGTRKIKEEGVRFKSHLDGSVHLFTPESVMDTQRKIGADIVMAFDECTPYPCEWAYARDSMHMTHRWLKRCMAQFDNTQPLYGYQQTLFPIVQGSVYKDLREESACFIADQEREGNAIGGLSVGEPADIMYEITERVCSLLPADKPRYLMGVGTPANVLEGIALGVDMFDCVLPSRNARHGILFTTEGILNIRNEKWKSDFRPVDEALGGYASTYYSRAYLRHLLVSEEILAAQIATLHNLRFYLWLVGMAREKIRQGSFLTWKNEMVQKLMQRL
jgi:queuine tRNA-ribosyltransferase